jgi:hypothetical protein
VEVAVGGCGVLAAVGERSDLFRAPESKWPLRQGRINEMRKEMVVACCLLLNLSA